MRLEAVCDHGGSHSPRATYDRGSGEMRYVTVCDACGHEIREIYRERYTPQYDPAGYAPYLPSAPARPA